MISILKNDYHRAKDPLKPIRHEIAKLESKQEINHQVEDLF
jgi:hypothetical protein